MAEENFFSDLSENPFADLPAAAPRAQEPAVAPGQEVPPDYPAPKPRFVPQGVPRQTPRERTTDEIIEGVLESPYVQAPLAGGEEAVRGARRSYEVAEALRRGEPVPAPRAEDRPSEYAQIKPSEAWASPLEKGVPWLGYMTGRGAGAMTGFLAGGMGGLPGAMGGAALGQFVTDFGPAVQENIKAGMSQDEAVSAALKSSGVSAAAAAAMFGLPVKVFAQVLGQPTIGASEQVIQNYIAGRPLTEGIGEAILGGLGGAAPVALGHGVRRLIRGRPRGEGEPQVDAITGEPLEPERPPERVATEPPATFEERFTGEPPAPPKKPPARAPEPTEPDLFSVAAAGTLPRVARPPRVREVPPPRVEPPREPPPPPEAVPPAPPAEVPPRPRERIPEIPEEEPPPAEPPEARGRVPEIPDYFADLPPAPPRPTVRQTRQDLIRERAKYAPGSPEFEFLDREIYELGGREIAAEETPEARLARIGAGPSEGVEPSFRRAEPAAGGEPATERYTLPEKMLEGKKIEAWEQYLQREDELGGLMREAKSQFDDAVKTINDAGLKVAQVNDYTARDRPDVRAAKRRLSEIGGSVNRLITGLTRGKGFPMDSPRVIGDMASIRDVLRREPPPVRVAAEPALPAPEPPLARKADRPRVFPERDVLEGKPTGPQRWYWQRPGEERQGPFASKARAQVALEDALAREPKPEDSLVQWVIRQGGIRTDDPNIGDARAVLGKDPRLYRKNGRSIADLTEGANLNRYTDDMTPAGFFRALEQDRRAMANDRPDERVRPAGAERAAPRMDERAAAIEAEAKRITDEFEKAGVRRDELDTDVLYDAADRLYRGEATNPLEAYDQAATGERYAQRPGVRGGGEEVYPGGGAGAGSRTEKAIIGARQEQPRARAPRPPPRQEVSREDLTHLNDTFVDKIGEGVRPLNSLPLRTALKELDVRHLEGIPERVTGWVRDRLARMVGDTPVHFITDADMQRWFQMREGDAARGREAPFGAWVEADDRAGKRRAFILVNADAAADARVGTHVILHEGTHAGAYNNLNKNPRLKGVLRLLMEEARERLVRAGFNADELYAFKGRDPHEFLSESFAWEPLQEWLASMPTTPRIRRELGLRGPIGTLWDSFKEIVRRLIGAPLNPRTMSMLEAVMRVGEAATRREGMPGAAGRTEAAMAGERPQYAVRADHDRRVYEVYDIATGKTRETFKYTNESSRGVAHGRANVLREHLNQQQRRTEMPMRAERPPSAEYERARAEHSEAARVFRQAQMDYRARQIGDNEFLAARTKYRAAEGKFDAAWEKEQRRSGAIAEGEPVTKQGQLVFPPAEERARTREIQRQETERQEAVAFEEFARRTNAERAPDEQLTREELRQEYYGTPPAEEPGAEGKPQLVIPGAEARPAEALQRKAEAPLKPRVEQKPTDFGLFGDSRNQGDLFSAPKPGGGRTELPMLAPGKPRFEQRQQRARENFAAKLARSYKENFQPELIGEKGLYADAAFAEFKSASAMERDRIYREGLKRERMWEKAPQADKLEFFRQVETGQPVKPQYRRAAELYRKMLDQAYADEKTWGSKAQYVDDYFPHLWERDRGKAPINDFIASMGPTWFQKARTFDLIEEGIRAGYRLKTDNPETLIRMRLLAGADMRMKMQLLDRLKDLGLAREAAGAEASNWFRINAPNREQWLVHPDAMPLWKNAVEAKGLWQNEGLTGDAFRGWMGFKNAWVPLKLALSAFHLVHVYGINLSLHFNRAFHELLADVPRHIARAQPLEAAKDVGRAVRSLYKGIMPRMPEGTMARQQWLLGDNARTPEGRDAVRRMNEGGFSPMMSEQLRIDAGNKFRDAMRNWLSIKTPVRLPYQAMRLGMQFFQSWLFEHWIPHLKTGAYLNAVARWDRMHPDLALDPASRRVAYRAIAKSMDNRFGEMFYGSLFWNRTVKDMGIGSFLSLGWNLGFVREFGGAAMEAMTRPAGAVVPAFRPSEARAIARGATDKISYAAMYFGTSMAMAGIMTYLFTGKSPEDIWDLIFPRVGGDTPEGTPRRLSTPFYTREIPMAIRHVQERGADLSLPGLVRGAQGIGDMIFNKMLLGPMLELLQNRNYYGQQIFDPEASTPELLGQIARHIGGEQLSPMSASGARRAEQAAGVEEPGKIPQTKEGWLAYMGFAPAPKYAERTAVQNRISQLYRDHVAPSVRAYEEPELGEEKRAAAQKVLNAIQSGDEDAIHEARIEAIQSGLSKRYVKELGRVSGDQRQWRQVSGSAPGAAMHLLLRMTEEERARYWPYTAKKLKQRFVVEHPDLVPE